MNLDVVQLVGLLKEGGSLLLLALVLFKFSATMSAALDRNSRILYRIEGKLGLSDSDRIPEQPKES